MWSLLTGRPVLTKKLNT